MNNDICLQQKLNLEPESKLIHKIKSKSAIFYLIGAIVLEVAGTSMLTYFARDGDWLGYLIMGVTITASYFLLSQAVKHIPVGIAYAIWEGVGLILLAIIGVLVFDEVLSLQKLAGLALAVIGIVCVSLGEKHRKSGEKK